jgi:hypothetical protein
MDSSITVPGTNFKIGLDPIIGLIPGIGDFIANSIGIYPIALAMKYKLSRIIILRMVLNLSVDYFFGVIPILGDIFDAAFKANQRNFRLLELGLNEPVKTRRRSLVFVALVTLILIFLILSPIFLLGWILAQL